MVEVVILAVCMIVSLATGLFVFVRNPRHVVNRVYATLTLALILFSVANYLSLKTDDRLLFIRAVILLSTVIVASLYYLVVVMGDRYRGLSRWQKFGVYATAGVAVLDFSPWVFSGLSGEVNPVPVPSFAAPLFVLHLLAFLTLGVGLLLKRIATIGGLQRLQHLYMLIGMLPIFLFAPLTGFLLPVVFKNSSFVFLSPVYGAIFVCAIGYAIVRHRLFDVRIVVARSLAYTLSLVAVASIYGFVVFGISQLVFDLHLSGWLQVSLSISTGLAVLVFSRFKVYFDSMTNRLFYRDAYDPQELFDEFNRALVSTIDLEVMLRRASQIIAKHLQTEFGIIGVKDGGENEFKIEGTDKIYFEAADIAHVRNLTPHMHHIVILTDDIPVEKAELRKLLRKYGISMLVRLTTDANKTQEGIGYIALGPKKSGNLFTKQDVKTIETLANELIIALQNAIRFEEIERFSETLQEEVESATRKLKATNRKLKKLNDTKDDFIGMASHQLRTPLTSAKGYISLVLDGDAGKINKNQRELLEQAFSSSQRMVYLIADLLNVSRLKTGKFTVERVPTHLPQLVRDEMDQLKKAVAAHDIELTFEAPKHFPTLQLDATKTRQVVMNFLDNALYYTPNGGHIRVELKDLPKSVEFRVIDDGIGVPKDEQHNLFTKFYRAKNAQRARPDGTGLGLYMAQKVIVIQGGAIIFDSKEGKGSTFGFSFPKELPANSPTIPELAVAEK